MQGVASLSTSVSAEAYRRAMANVPSGVHVITTDGPAGRYGITMTAVMSVTDSPPTLMLCINRKAAIQPILRQNGSLCINILSAGQQDVAEHFAGITRLKPEERWQQHLWAPAGPDNQPQLSGALACLHGKIEDAAEIGSHTVFRVLLDSTDVADETSAALLYFRRHFSATESHPEHSPP